MIAEDNDASLSRNVSHALGALAAAQLLLGSAAAPALAIDTTGTGSAGKLGAPAQNKEATDLPSSFFRTGDELQKKLGIDTDPDNIGDKIQPGTKGLNGVSQQDGKLNNVAKASTDATLKAAQNITPDLSELPNASDLPNPFDSTGFADKAKGIVKDAVNSVPDPSEAVDKAKGAGKELGRNLPDPSAAADKVKGNAKGLANDLPNPADTLRNKRI
ncbi:hypothetical protein COCSUDRAFT_62976 [Coccomyxa subellipsoidea C-169]|uniref:Uncharacterized protein n=1 Tax=Coccomyxa subellipsoidea (strain C-169) TaxID=574566 RepID=I0YYH0_COCSC|nr:hypothetical protein COCSUDRAFT_62976 [Coccomyxa subellipsoidea C-169]EIE23439.1 hypothetical protein COCSUDRAFT_62976 [Coccomyxa subellipsoidea C-169]|eukprot:XP_005647983.1 hypothetical protein COCSUDRAFT_62976 [Coccomyxa subellipsoidea C-169]